MAALIVMYPVIVAAGGALESGVEPFLGGLTWQSLLYSVWEQFLCIGIVRARGLVLVLLGLRYGQEKTVQGLPVVVYKGHDVLRRFAGCQGTTACREIHGEARVPVRCIGVVRQPPVLCAESIGADCTAAISAAQQEAFGRLYAHWLEMKFHWRRPGQPGPGSGAILALAGRNDDLFVDGTTVTMDGTVNGDLIAAGQTVTINGKVSGNVIATGGSVAVNGEVGHNVFAAGGVVTLGPGARISHKTYTRAAAWRARQAA